MTTSRTCTRCGVEKPLTEYYRNAKSKGGRLSRCKACTAARQAEYREVNKERIAVRDRAYREANAERIAANKKAYREANHEDLRVYYKAYHVRRWANDPEYRERIRAKRRASATRYYRLLASAKQEPYTRQEILKRDEWTCWLCDEPIDRDLRAPDPGSPSIDHVVPLSRGGDDTPANVRAAHFGCNSARGARVEHEDRAVAA